MLRVLKRYAAAEDGADVFVDLLLKSGKTGAIDLSLSVYDVGAAVVQMHAEHRVGFLKHPPPKQPFAHLSCAAYKGRVGTSPGTGPFAFTRAAHRTLDFNDEAEAVDFARELHRTLLTIRGESQRKDVAHFICSQLDAGDSEWVSVCSQKTEWEKWARRNR